MGVRSTDRTGDVGVGDELRESQIGDGSPCVNLKRCSFQREGQIEPVESPGEVGGNLSLGFTQERASMRAMLHGRRDGRAKAAADDRSVGCTQHQIQAERRRNA